MSDRIVQVKLVERKYVCPVLNYVFELGLRPQNLRPFFNNLYMIGGENAMGVTFTEFSQYTQDDALTVLMRTPPIDSDFFTLALSQEKPSQRTVDRFVDRTVEPVEFLFKAHYGKSPMDYVRRVTKKLPKELSFSISPDHELGGFLERTYIDMNFGLLEREQPLIKCKVEIKPTPESHPISQDGLDKLEDLVIQFRIPITASN